ncbi:hypothetical protein [Hyphobacterium sp. CCMP332]|uniref:hypothetical protein n=1 Tax=Hyphobacterium sp. CCMP332 TaxID=2749086 RepID=UPI001F20EC86|nr:hypothetical protein [Hyphobacterium sp. CCMP332]
MKITQEIRDEFGSARAPNSVDEAETHPPHPEVRANASLEGSDITPTDIEQRMAEKAREFNEKGGEIYLAEERPAKSAD